MRIYTHQCVWLSRASGLRRSNGARNQPYDERAVDISDVSIACCCCRCIFPCFVHFYIFLARRSWKIALVIAYFQTSLYMCERQMIWYFVASPNLGIIIFSIRSPTNGWLHHFYFMRKSSQIHMKCNESRKTTQQERIYYIWIMNIWTNCNADVLVHTV